jgi:hypothetical protein
MPTAQRGHELKIAALGTYLMERVRVVVAIAQEIALHVGCPHHATRHDPFVLVHRRDSPSRDNSVDSLD